MSELLTGYLEYKDRINHSAFNAVVPHNFDHALDRYNLNSEFLNQQIPPFQKTHVEDVPLISNHNYLNYVIRNVSQNVVGISIGKGEPLGTGLLLTENLILTVRHCVEGRNISDFKIRRNYQKVNGVMNLSHPRDIIRCVESNRELDYAILEVNQPFQNVQGNIFDTEARNSNQSISSLLFHHPNGGAKKVSLHRSLGGCNTGHFSSFHDTDKGSSGGIYVSLNGAIFAIHSLRFDVGFPTASSIFIRNILDASPLLQSIIYRNAPAPILDTYYFLSRSNDPNRPYWQRVTNPLPNLNTNRNTMFAQQISLTYHHIIPVGDMEFLWMIAKENPLTQRFITQNQLHFFYERGDNQFTINSLAYATWNLFIGPTNRNSNDDRRDENIERQKPLSFPEDLWDNLNNLYNSLNNLWNARLRLYNRFNQEQQDQNQFRRANIRNLDHHDHEPNLDQTRIGFPRQQNRRLNNTQLEGYRLAIDSLHREITAITHTLARNNLRGYKQEAHPYNRADWDRLPDGTYRLSPTEQNRGNRHMQRR